MSYNKKDGSITTTKTIRMPNDLCQVIESLATKNDRDFSKQVIHMVKKYLEFQEIPIAKRGGDGKNNIVTISQKG